MSFQIPHINGIMFRVFLCLTSLSMIISRSTHVAAKSMISFFSWLSSISLCVCVRIHTHTYMYTHIHVYIRTCTCICAHMCIYVCTRVYVHTRVYMCAHTCICTHTRVYTHAHVYMYTPTCIYVHTHVYMYTHPHLLHPFLSVDISVASRPGCCEPCCCEHRVHESFWIKSTSRPEGTSTFSFGGTFRLFSIVAASVYIPTNSVGGTITHFFKTVAMSSEILYLLIILRD